MKLMKRMKRNEHWLGWDKVTAAVLEQAMGLSDDGKLRLISALCDSMAQDPDKIPLPEWQVEELERRMQSQRNNPQPGQTWDEVKKEVSRR